jgi:microcystin-dependent protein
MTQPYVGEIRMFGGSYAPSNWAFCNGQTMSIANNQVLYTLIGTTYGGDGVSTFNLPNLQGRLAVGMGQGNGLSLYNIGQVGGTESVTLTTATMGAHNHPLVATITGASLGTPTANLTGKAPSSPANQHMYTLPGSPSPTIGSLNPQAVGMNNGNLPHPNLMPSLCVSFIIALYGIFPSQS